MRDELNFPHDDSDDGDYLCDFCLAGEHDDCDEEDCLCPHPFHSNTVEEYDEMVDLQLERGEIPTND